MPGEHFCTHCEDNVSKHKGTYTKLYFYNFDPEEDDIINVVCPSCRKEDETLDKGLTTLEDAAKPVETFKGARKCIFCRERIKKKERSIRAEFRYNGSELRVDVCEKCIDEHEDIKAIHLEVPNPEFNFKGSCISAGVCESFKKPGKDLGLNCLNVVVNLEGVLYCKRAHPGHLRVPRERWAFPPSQLKLRKMLKILGPLFENFKDGAKLLAKETSAAQAAIRDIPDILEFQIKEFPLEGDMVSMPWNAHVIKVDEGTLTAMILVEKKEEEQ